DLAAQLVRPRREAVEDVDKVGLPGRGETKARCAVHLSHQGESEQPAQQGADDLGPGGPGTSRIDQQPQAALARLLVLAHARNRWRRMAAALEKMRMPRTTTTAVESWLPTPSWSPRKTMSAATRTFAMNDTTKTLSSKIPSRIARIAPNTASSAATTAIGKYGCKPTGTVGCKMTPTTTPTARAMAAITAIPTASRSGRPRWPPREA